MRVRRRSNLVLVLVLALVFILPSTALKAVLHIDVDAHVTGKTA